MLKLFGRRSAILMFIVIFVLCFSVAFYIFLRLRLRTRESELAELQAQIAEVQMDNDNINYLINEADADELYEHLARERGYVYPDEKVYYDVTPGK